MSSSEVMTPHSPGTAETGSSSNTPERDVPVPVVNMTARKNRTGKVRKQSKPSNTKALEFGPNGSDAIDRAIEERMSAMDVPTGNSAEDRKKRRRIRNCISAQLHRERKRAYLESLEKKIKEQDSEIKTLRSRVEDLEAENKSLRNGTERKNTIVCNKRGSEEFELAQESSCMPGMIEHINASDLSCFDTFPTPSIEYSMDAEMKKMEQLDVFADEMLSGLDVDSVDPPLVDEDYEIAAKLEPRPKKRKRGNSSRVGGLTLVALTVCCMLGLSMIAQPTLNGDGVGSQRNPLPQRTRHLLSLENISGTQSEFTESKGVDLVDPESRALAMWGDILRLHKNRSESMPAATLEVLFSKLENLKVNKSPDVGPSKLRGMNRALVPYGIKQHANKGAISEALKSLSVLRQGVYNQRAISELPKASNTSMILCPRVYGMLNKSSSSASANQDKIMLVLPSSALEFSGDDEAKKSNRGWDGKWIEVDALVTGVRPLVIDHPSVSGVISSRRS